jgi:hypothetical protein
MNWEHIKETLVARALEGILLALGTALLAVLPVAENYLAQYAQTLTPIATVRVVVLLTAAVLLALAFAFYGRPKLKFSQIDGGVWIDIKTGIRYCPNCRTKKILSPLRDKDDLYWDCPVVDCNKRFRKKMKYP